jgi:hypothetical protein
MHITSGKLSDKLKVWLLSCLMLLACTPNLHASSQCATPLETNCVVGGCSYPSGCTYTITLTDSTPGATIHWSASESGVGPVGQGTITSGQSFTVSASAYCPVGAPGCYPAGSMYGNAYATAPGYTQSQTMSLSF